MPNSKLPIFVSYAHYDNESDDPERRWLDRLLQFLRPLELEDKISTWSDSKLKPGQDWKREIDRAMAPAKVVILLVSPAFLASEFIRSEELPRLLCRVASTEDLNAEGAEDGAVEDAVVIPIVIRPCLIEDVAFSYTRLHESEQLSVKLSDFQYLPAGEAMSGLSQHEQDEQFMLVGRRILEALRDSKPVDQVAMPTDERETLEEALSSFLQRYGRYFFNAVRIRNWGSKQTGCEIFGDHRTWQIEEALRSLASAGRVEAKDGKKSRIYKWITN